MQLNYIELYTILQLLAAKDNFWRWVAAKNVVIPPLFSFALLLCSSPSFLSLFRSYIFRVLERVVCLVSLLAARGASEKEERKKGELATRAPSVTKPGNFMA